MSDMAQWLASLNLEQYAEAFENDAIEIDLLPEITDDDLKALGVVALGHRKRILKAITALSPEPESSPGPTSRSTPSTDSQLQSPSAAQPVVSQAERRQLTVMFCDLVGSVALAEQMDVEDYRDLLTGFRNAVVSQIEAAHGFVAKHLGDGILAYFGYPQASENDPERAVRAGLGIVEAVTVLDSPGGAVAKVRVGIATGEAVVGDVLETGASDQSELAALGTTPNLAARLQGEAEPDSVIISETTQRVVSGLFELQELPPRTLKGMTEDVSPFRVVRELRGQSRFAARTGSQLSSFVGRSEELGSLNHRWSRTQAGEGQVAMVVGVPGIGKSRLLQELTEQLDTGPAGSVSFQCSPDHENSAFYPVTSGFERMLGFSSSMLPQTRRDLLTEHLQVFSGSEQMELGFLPEFLGIESDDTLAEADLEGPARRRERTLRVLVDYVINRAAGSAFVCIIEDVHWADPSTNELISRLVNAIEDQKVFLVLTTRPGYQAGWTDSPHAQVLTLSRLGRVEGAELAEAVAVATSGLNPETLKEILARGEGNPLYIEELTRSVQQHHAGATAQTAVPASLRDSLMARLDALGAGKAVAQWASVIGRTFDSAVLHAVWDKEPENLRQGLEELERAGLASREGEGELTRYVFRNNLIRDTAYDTLLRDARSVLHRRLASVIENEFPDLRKRQPELLARHYAAAGVADTAIEFWLDAVRLTFGRSAMAEALAHVASAEAELASVADTAHRAQLELATALLKGPALMNVHGSGSQVVADTYRHALELAERVGRAEDRFTATWGLWLHHQMVGNFESAQASADDIVTIGRDLSDSTYLLQAHHSAWTTEGHVGNHEKTHRHTEEGLALYDFEKHRRSMVMYGDHDAGVCGYVHRNLTSWSLGYFDQAEELASSAVELARKLKHPPSLMMAETHAAMFCQFLGEADRVLEIAERIEQSSATYGLTSWRLNAEILIGWAKALSGEPGGFAQMETAIAAREAAGSRLRQPYFQAIYAQQLASVGRQEEAVPVLESALAILDQTGERRWEPLLQAVKGEVLSVGEDAAAAERQYQLAVAIARKQQALGFELAAACGLARLWSGQQRSEEANNLLSGTFGRFSEGFEKQPLREARVLLESVS